MDNEAYIIDAVRSPRGKGKKTGALHEVHPQRVLAQVLNAIQERNGFDTGGWRHSTRAGRWMRRA